MILRERVPCRAPLVGLALIGLLGIAVLPGWTKGQAPVPAGENAKVSENKVGLAPHQRLPEKKEHPAILESALRQSPADETAPRSEDPLTDAQAAESLAPQAGLPGQASPSEGSGDGTELGLPIDARSVSVERAQQLRQIETLERRMAELAAELKMLRGQEVAADKQANLHRVYGVPPKVAMAQVVAAGPHPVIDLGLPYSNNHKEVQLRMAENQQIRLRLTENEKVGEIKMENAENMRLVSKSPLEIVLMAVRPGKAVATLMGEGGSRLIIRADILPAEEHLITERHATATRKLGYVASLKPDERLAGDVETLTRAKYKLPPGRAQALAAFIQAQIKEEVETKVDDDTLVVTASSDDQAKIGQFIQLLKKTPERTEAPEERRDDGRSSSDAFGEPSIGPPSTGFGTEAPRIPAAGSSPLAPAALDSSVPNLHSN